MNPVLAWRKCLSLIKRLRRMGRGPCGADALPINNPRVSRRHLGQQGSACTQADRPPILIFQHISKTAGSTLSQVMLRKFPPEDRLWLEPAATISALGTWEMEHVRRTVEAQPPEVLDKIRFVGGHLGFGVHTLLPRPARYITLLRDPVERVISGFYYSIATHQGTTGELVSLEEYVFRKRHYDLGLNNYQVRVLSGLADLDPPQGVTTANAKLITDFDLQLVRKNLERYYLLVGLTERFDEFLVVLCSLLGWNLADAVYQRRNITRSRPRRQDVPDRVIAEIECHNLFDRRLHEHARSLFAGAVDAYGPAFTEDLSFFRRINQWYNEGVSLAELRCLAAQRPPRARLPGVPQGN